MKLDIIYMYIHSTYFGNKFYLLTDNTRFQTFLLSSLGFRPFRDRLRGVSGGLCQAPCILIPPATCASHDGLSGCIVGEPVSRRHDSMSRGNYRYKRPHALSSTDEGYERGSTYTRAKATRKYVHRRPLLPQRSPTRNCRQNVLRFLG